MIVEIIGLVIFAETPGIDWIRWIVSVISAMVIGIYMGVVSGRTQRGRVA